MNKKALGLILFGSAVGLTYSIFRIYKLSEQWKMAEDAKEKVEAAWGMPYMQIQPDDPKEYEQVGQNYEQTACVINSMKLLVSSSIEQKKDLMVSTIAFAIPVIVSSVLLFKNKS